MNTPASDQSVSLQKAVYIVDGGAGADSLKQANADQKPAVPGESKLMRIYWFLGGR